MILSFGGKTPRDEGAVFVAANATVLGDVTLGKGTNIWYGGVLRGDEGPPGSSRPSGTTSWPTTSKTPRPMWRWGGSTRRCEILRCILRRIACTAGFSMLSSSQNRARPARTEV